MSCLFCCGAKKSHEKVILEEIFLHTKQFPPDKQTKTVDLKDEQVIAIKAFVKDRSKALNDYLENNQRKLKDIGKFLLSKVQDSRHPADHLMSLFILNNLMPVIKSFSYDKGRINKLVAKTKNYTPTSNRTAGSQSKYNKYDASVLALLNKNLAENYLVFENFVKEIFDFLLDVNYTWAELIFPHVVETVAVYGNSIPDYDTGLSVKTNKQGIIVGVLRSSMLTRQLTDSEDVSLQKKIVEGLFGITSNSESKLAPEVRYEVITFLTKILKASMDSGAAGPLISEASEANMQMLPGLHQSQTILLSQFGGANTNRQQLLSSLENSIFGILKNILKNDFRFFDVRSLSDDQYVTTLSLLFRWFDSQDWKYVSLQNRCMKLMLETIHQDQYATTIEGELVDLLIQLLISSGTNRVGLIVSKHDMLGRDLAEGLSDFRIKETGEVHLVSFLRMVIQTTSMSSGPFGIERIVVSLVRKALFHESKPNQRDLMLNALCSILQRLMDGNPSAMFYFLESYLHELIVRSDQGGNAQDELCKLNQRIEQTLAESRFSTFTHSGRSL